MILHITGIQTYSSDVKRGYVLAVLKKRKVLLTVHLVEVVIQNLYRHFHQQKVTAFDRDPEVIEIANKIKKNKKDLIFIIINLVILIRYQLKVSTL